MHISAIMIVAPGFHDPTFPYSFQTLQANPTLREEADKFECFEINLAHRHLNVEVRFPKLPD